ncbi:MAG: MarR family winged helix-turn-helix transcriptional regulator [Intrasporangium sp.]|uniref:MarR family winged helix-turn-helix transcriptional regulator n=1 Tax=Intrasporangium sp. TaxID=1925024 RepID=UPI003F7F99F5
MGLTHPPYLGMRALWEEAPLKASQLARRLSLEPATLSPMLKRLEANGMITRESNPEDERALAVDLTAKGRKAREQAEQVPKAIVQRLGMSLDELEELHRNLMRVIAACAE